MFMYCEGGAEMIRVSIVKLYLTRSGEKMKNEGDFVSGMTDAEPPSCYEEV